MAMWVVLIIVALGLLSTLLRETGIKTNNDVDPCAHIRMKDWVWERNGTYFALASCVNLPPKHRGHRVRRYSLGRPISLLSIPEGTPMVF